MMLLSPTVSFVLYHCTFFIYVCFYGSLCFRTTVRFYASTRLLYADCQFCFIPLYVSTYYVRFYGSLCFYTTVRFYASMMLLYADCQFCFIPLYVLHIYDATVRGLPVLFYTTVCFYILCTFLRITLLLHHCTILRIYDATVR